MAGTAELLALTAQVASLTLAVSDLTTASNRQATASHVTAAKIDGWDDFWRGTNGAPGFRQDLDTRCHAHTDEIGQLRDDVAELQAAAAHRGSRLSQWAMLAAQWGGALLIAWYTSTHTAK